MSSSSKIRQHADPAKIDYVVMNHAEPDHANGIKVVLAVARNATLVTSAKGKEAAMMYFGVPAERIMVVDEKSKLELGGKTLRFVDAPWLHWPETIFTYLEEDGILFPCDFFGSHIASGEFYADEFGDQNALDMAKLYFAEIMMPFRKPGATAVEKVRKLGVKMIAPSHGVMWRDPKVILDPYTDWTSEKMAKKVMIVYVSMWGSTEKMAHTLWEALVKKGVDVRIFDITNTDIGHIAKELVDTPVIVVGAPTVLGGAHPVAAYAASLVKTLRAPTELCRRAQLVRMERRCGEGAGGHRERHEDRDPGRGGRQGPAEAGGPREGPRARGQDRREGRVSAPAHPLGPVI